MAMYLLLFANALLLSAIAAYYSVYGLIAIFSASAVPVAVMGTSLEVAKLVVASWLYRYWSQIPILMRTYFTVALGILMLITSMGIFGYLSKAHLDQGVPIGDVAAKVAIIDEKIKTEKDNIEASRKALKQLDDAVDQILGRSSDERGAERAVQIRRSQQAERARLIKEIEVAQKKVAALNEERTPIAAEVRKVEAEVGPIKYIAALIYGDDADGDTLEKAVRWLIIILIVVFDPLAVLMLIAANLTQIKKTSVPPENTPPQTPPPTDIPVPKEPIEQIHLEWPEQGKTETPTVLQIAEVEPIITTVVETNPNLELPELGKTETPAVQQVAEVEPKLELPEPEVKPKRKRKAKEQVQQDTYTEPENVSMDFNNEVDKMIDQGDTEGLEAVYKKIVKELGKKNRAKTTHWGPLRSSR